MFMSDSQFILHAPNIHCGGGLTLLKALIEVLPDDACLIVDERIPVSFEALERFRVQRVKPTLWHRFGAERLLAQMVRKGDNVLCFGNLPPVFRLKGRVELFLQNRYLIDKVSLIGFPLKLRLRLMMERFWFRFFKSHVNRVVVQSSSMQNLLALHFQMSAAVMPFVACANDLSKHVNTIADSKKPYDFIYVASGEPHKNHRNLIKAWINLAMKGVRPSLCLTVNKDQFPDLVSWIEKEKSEYNLNIDNLGSISGDEILTLYMKAQALIFPSTLESFGLPLIEARKAHLSIVASELDYVRDVIDPDESFDPGSSVSIARAVERYLGEEENRLAPLDAASFLQHVFRG